MVAMIVRCGVNGRDDRAVRRQWSRQSAAPTRLRTSTYASDVGAALCRDRCHDHCRDRVPMRRVSLRHPPRQIQVGVAFAFRWRGCWRTPATGRPGENIGKPSKLGAVVMRSSLPSQRDDAQVELARVGADVGRVDHAACRRASGTARSCRRRAWSAVLRCCRRHPSTKISSLLGRTRSCFSSALVVAELRALAGARRARRSSSSPG